MLLFIPRWECLAELGRISSGNSFYSSINFYINASNIFKHNIYLLFVAIVHVVAPTLGLWVLFQINTLAEIEIYVNNNHFQFERMHLPLPMYKQQCRDSNRMWKAISFFHCIVDWMYVVAMSYACIWMFAKNLALVIYQPVYKFLVTPIL